MFSAKWLGLSLGLLVMVVFLAQLLRQDNSADGREGSGKGGLEQNRSAMRVASKQASYRDGEPAPVVSSSLGSSSSYAQRLVGLEVGSSQYHKVLAEITAAWGKEDPAALADWLFELEQQGGIGVRLSLSDMANSWAKRDPQAALEHFQSSDLCTESQRILGMSNILMEWAQQEPVGAWQALGGIPELSDDSSLMTEILSSWTGIDASAASQEISNLINGGNDQAEWGNLVIDSLLSPSEAEDEQGLDEAELRESSLGRIEVARLWLEALPLDSNVRSVATAALARNWLKVEPSHASQWLVDLPDSEGRTNGIQAMVSAVTPNDPESALIWALELPSGNLQESLLSRAYSYWQAKEPEAAAQFAEAHFDEAILDIITEPDGTKGAEEEPDDSP